MALKFQWHWESVEWPTYEGYAYYAVMGYESENVPIVNTHFDHMGDFWQALESASPSEGLELQRVEVWAEPSGWEMHWEARCWFTEVPGYIPPGGEAAETGGLLLPAVPAWVAKAVVVLVGLAIAAVIIYFISSGVKQLSTVIGGSKPIQWGILAAAIGGGAFLIALAYTMVAQPERRTGLGSIVSGVGERIKPKEKRAPAYSSYSTW